MPTAKELDVMMQADGGSGDPKEDALVARNLQHILDMPEQQVLSYIKTRDRNSVHKLKMVLQEMPSTDWTSGAGSRAPSRAASATSRRSKKSAVSSTMQSIARRQQQLHPRSQERIDELSAMKSSYGNFFGSKPEPGGMFDSTAKAFDGVVRKRYQPDFDHWRETAPEGQVRVLADACRSLRYFSNTGMPATSYNAVFANAGGHTGARIKEKSNSRNVSAVPLGSIYSQSEEDAAVVEEMRKDQMQATMEAAQRQLDMNRTIASANFKDKPRMDTRIFVEPPPDTAHASFEANPVHPGNSRSAARISWHGDVHSKVQVMRHGHAAIKPGERAWAQCSADAIFNLRDPALQPGPPSPSKLITSKLWRGVGKSISQPALSTF